MILPFSLPLITILSGSLFDRLKFMALLAWEALPQKFEQSLYQRRV